jgi:hypothetical protein
MKTKGLAIISLVVIATVAGIVVFSLQSTAKADSANIVSTDAQSITAPTSTSTATTNIYPEGFNNGMIAFDMGPRFGMGHRGFGGISGFRNIQVSSDFTQNVTNILQSDSDVQNLISQGFNITTIRPVISTVIDGNGNIVTKASTANVLLQGDNGSRSFVVVDLSQAKVTKIVTLTFFLIFLYLKIVFFFE